MSSPRPAAAPNILNQDDLGYIFQDLKTSNSRLWQAITSLKAYMAPMPINYEFSTYNSNLAPAANIAPPCIVRLPTDPYGKWKVQSILIQDITLVSKTKPTSGQIVVDILVSRDKRRNYFSIFKSTSDKAIVRSGGDYWSKIEIKELGTTELFEEDDIRIDLLQAGSGVANFWLLLRGTANLLKDKGD